MYKKIDKAVIFRISARITNVSPFTASFPAQAVGVISDYLRKINIAPFAYDITDILGRENAQRLLSRIYRNAVRLKDQIKSGYQGYDIHFDNLGKEIKLKRPPLILISLEHASSEGAIVAILLSMYLKRLDKHILIIAGGEIVHQVGYVREFFRENRLHSIDFIVKGHHLESLKEIIKTIRDGKDFSNIPAIVYYDKERKQVSEAPYFETPQIMGGLDFERINLDYYRLKISEVLPRKYIYNSHQPLLLIPFTFIHGCPHICAFCENSTSKCLSFLEPGDIVRILQELSSRYNTPYFMFLNNTLNIRYDYLDELCERIIQSGLKITWSDCVNIKNLDRKLLFKLRKAGAAKLVFGLETGSDRMLRLCQKNITSDDAARCLRWSHEAGIWNSVEIITGLPHEKEEDIDKTIDFLNANRDIINEIHVNPFMLLSGSYYFEKPALLGIENIVDTGVDMFRKLKGRGNVALDYLSYRYEFDERDGKKWKEKVNQIVHSYTKVLMQSKVRVYPTTNIDLQVLLYLYHHIDDKSEIVRIYSSFLRRANFKKLFKKDTIFYFLRQGQYLQKAIAYLKRIR